jgi:Flp pilus assembly protein TadD
MLKFRYLLIIPVLILYVTPLQGQELKYTENLFSPSVSQVFYEIAYELTAQDTNTENAQQAILYLTAALNLDTRAAYIMPELIKIASRQTDQDYSQLIYNLLVKYTDKSADLDVTAQAIRYLLERLDSREQREQMLLELLRSLGGKNLQLDSELATLLGLLMAEKTDYETAQYYFIQAYNKNNYNGLAFAKLAELIPEQLSPATYLEQTRLALTENPLDINAAMTFAQYAEQLQLYEVAADAYKYAADLFEYLYPSQPLPDTIYISWTLNSYNTQRRQNQCLNIVEQLRQKGIFNLFAEVIAAKATEKIVGEQKALQALKAAEEKAKKLFSPGLAQPSAVTALQLAWFYCFAMPEPENALDWANKAYSVDPNSSSAATILAYALMMNGQDEWAQNIIKNYDQSQISLLTLAKIQIKNEQNDLAIQTLNEAINENPGALEAQFAKDLLRQIGGEYLPPVDADLILTTFTNSFQRNLIPEFVTPERIISAQLNTRGTKFTYGTKLGGTLAITNLSSEPLVISDASFFTGRIRIDAVVTGDINKKINNLVSLRIRPASQIAPGSSFLIPLRLTTGQLRKILLTHPQASFDIEFKVYLDPVIDQYGQITNNLPGFEPTTLVITRQKLELTGKYLRNRFESLKQGKQGQKINAAQLFAGLLAEQNVMAGREPLYKFMYADWMPELLKSAIIHNLTDDDWVVKAHTMAAIFSLPMDYGMINALAENLNDENWPVRMMTLSLLAKNQHRNFKKVLDWAAKYDNNILVRAMAVALGAEKPQIPLEQNQQDSDNQEQPEN